MSQKDRDTSYSRLFAEELRLAEEAKEVVRDRALSGKELYKLHQELAGQYEKLLKTTIKLSRISDIQGKKLKEQEQEIQTANESLKHLEKLRQRLIADISHELGTPMVAVQGYVKALLDGVIQPEEKYMRLIYDRVLTVNHLIKDLFLLSTFQANQNHFEHQRIEIGAFVRAVERKFMPDCERAGIAFDMEMPGEGADPVIVWGDPVRLDQVFENLLRNAMKFTQAGGSIRLCSEFQPKYEGALLGHWFVKVSDSGIGIAEEEVPHVFERFYRSKRASANGIEGTGLGLAITKEIIQKHGGEIGVTSRAGEGSTFFFLIPAESVTSVDGQTRSMIKGGLS
ncbi:HAMP domain-containing sensor histidine kinase [Paenibacillus validus]|uniref:histidine kinase n=1 Tax=Paenibacillus validus TaxID=44253 RepID=A0A7X2ZFD1_9BACL|nr:MULTISPECIES: HAMP domain-containing sensor histidine kinase [Paenibacillus]MED4602671.1 HAMP domain-containing sensor histidine kinase [Paenibacillus validus]MED4608925.1 HAMP domain-containing sensor histidine kinase [Paenibacillus validus]MUG73834.1 hypothetical protein [Paenibacillus validus]